MRELELEFGCARAHGPYITVETEEGPKIVRMSRAERAARGLLRDPEGPRITARAQRAERNLTAASFQRWLTDGPRAALHRVISARGATWQDAHEALAEFGCVLQPKGSGMVVTTTLSNGRVLAAKASLLGRWAFKASLERVLGPYTESAPSSSRRADRQRSYEPFIERERLAENRPRRVRDDAQRLARRAARAEARRTLAERFAREQAQLRERRRREREALRQRQAQQRRTLASAHREQRRRLRAQSRALRRDGLLALALRAFAAAREREALQRRQAAEQRALTEMLPRAEVWRGWLKGQVAAGDEAAQAALRGIRYRERRRLTERETGPRVVQTPPKPHRSARSRSQGLER